MKEDASSKSDKIAITDIIQRALEDVRHKSAVLVHADSVEVQRIGSLLIQMRIRYKQGAPRYFNVKVSEML